MQCSKCRSWSKIFCIFFRFCQYFRFSNRVGVLLLASLTVGNTANVQSLPAAQITLRSEYYWNFGKFLKLPGQKLTFSSLMGAQFREHKRRQEKVQFYCEDDSLFLSSYYVSMPEMYNLLGNVSKDANRYYPNAFQSAQLQWFYI